MKKTVLAFSIFCFLPLSAGPTLWDFIYRQWAEAMLIRAAEKGNLDNVKYYLSQRCNVNKPSGFSSEEDYTPLKAAVRHDHWQVVKHLLRNGAHLSSAMGRSELAMAVRHHTIFTPFILMLWGGKENVERRHKGEAVEEIEKK